MCYLEAYLCGIILFPDHSDFQINFVLCEHFHRKIVMFQRVNCITVIFPDTQTDQLCKIQHTSVSLSNKALIAYMLNVMTLLMIRIASPVVRAMQIPAMLH